MSNFKNINNNSKSYLRKYKILDMDVQNHQK